MVSLKFSSQKVKVLCIKRNCFKLNEIAPEKLETVPVNDK